MKIGAMTNPQRDLAGELRQIAAEGFDTPQAVIQPAG
jgi:hypothetical protein